MDLSQARIETAKRASKQPSAHRYNGQTKEKASCQPHIEKNASEPKAMMYYYLIS
jgi:hypothetical protein